MSKHKGFPVVDSPYLVPDDGSFRVKKAHTAPPKHAGDDDELKAQLRDDGLRRLAVHASDGCHS